MRARPLAPVLLLSALFACADDPAGGLDELGSEDTGAPQQICPTALADSIQPPVIVADLQALDALAAANQGNRAAGSPGYDVSVDYIEVHLRAAGYTVERWAFEFDRFVEQEPTELAFAGSMSGPWPPLEAKVDFGLASWSPAGQVEAPVQAVDLALGLDNSSSSGCEPEDFADFDPGNVALIQRGSCNFATKASNAEAAGAVAVLLFNQGDREDRTGLFNASLGSSNQLSLPVLTMGYDLGVAVSEAAAMEVVTASLSAEGVAVPTPSVNLIAETAGGDPSKVVMLGAHLDSVDAGPGINDNGSGSALILELARQMASCSPRNKVRFAWWGGEEWGLQGSRAWVEDRSPEQLADLALYLNFDMVASPNYMRAIHDGVGGPEGSVEIYQAFVDAFTAQGLTTTTTPFAGNTDYQPFVDAGLPAGGLHTGAGSAKTEEEAALFGGEAGAAYDACYHQACDTQANINLEALEQNARAAATVLERFAGDLGPLEQ